MSITKTAMVTVCGRPNVGKSTLTNALVGEKIAIVSNKPQTTRNRIYGVVNRDDIQFVFLDTPGFHKAKNRLGDYMVKVTRESIADVDAVVLIVEPIPHVGIPEQELIKKIKEAELPAVLCINKIDTIEKKDDLLAVIQAYTEAHDFDAIIPISALKQDGLRDLLIELAKYAEEGPQLFPDGMVTDQPDRQVVGEIGEDAPQPRQGDPARHGGGDHALCRARRRGDRGRGDHLLRKEKPQGHHHRQGWHDAEKNQHRGAPRHRALHGREGVSANVGQGQGKLAG